MTDIKSRIDTKITMKHILKELWASVLELAAAEAVPAAAAEAALPVLEEDAAAPPLLLLLALLLPACLFCQVVKFERKTASK